MKELIEQTKLAIAELENERDKVLLHLAPSMVVRCQGLTLAFDIDAAGVASNPRNAPPYLATRFHLVEARRIAAKVKNGNSIAGEAVHVCQAIGDAIDGQRMLLGVLQAHKSTDCQVSQ